MKKRKGLGLIAILIMLALIGAGAYFLLRDEAEAPGVVDNGGNNNGGSDNGGNGGNNGGTGATTSTNAMIRVASPQANATVRSPLVITGEARGNWYFEASFPVKIVDANGTLLGQHYAEAQGEWMTTDFVPFRATLNFATSTTPTGTLILEKDNPSGLPQNAAEVRIPIRFEQTVASRVVKLYFYNESLDKDASGNVHCSAQGLVATDRTIPRTNTPIQDAVRELLKSDPSFAGVTLTGASVSSGTLTLTFSDPQNKTSGGACKVSILRAQIEATAKQFGGVSSVRYSPSSVFQP